MKYIDFHKLCLDTLMIGQYGFSDMRQVVCSGTHIKVHAPSMEMTVKRYLEQYNNLKMNETNPHGITIDRFIMAHEVESRYAQDDWDRFEITYHEVSYEAPKALKMLMNKHFPKVEQHVLTQVYKMHLDKKIQTNTFNAQGGQRFCFTCKTFKDIYTILLQNEVINADIT